MSEDTGRPDVLARMRELDRRKLAAAKPAKDAQIARARQRTKERMRRIRARIKDMQTSTTQTDKCESASPLSAAQKAKQYQALFGETSEPKANPIRNDLVKLSRDRKAPASARVTALRTLAEMDGLVGKLQTQANETSDAPLATMTRSQLERELERLRGIVAGREP